MGQHCVTFPFHLVCFGEEKSVIQNFLAEVLLIKVKMPTCAICKIEAPSEKHLKVHIKAKHDDRVLTCEKCEKKCIGGTKLRTHMEYHREVTCKHCEKRIPYNSRNSHKEKCGEFGEFKCKNCPVVFTRKHHLKEDIDKNRCEIQCNICDKTLKSAEFLEKHIQTTHRVQINVVKTKEGHIGRFQSTELQHSLNCTQCDFVAAHPSKLKRHMIKHDPKPVKIYNSIQICNPSSWLAKMVTLVTLIWPVCCLCVTSHY